MGEDTKKLSVEQILETEYCNKFDEIRKKMMVMSFHKYGALKENYEDFGCMDAMANAKKRIEAYEKTGNTEFLADAANFLMIEFMYPQIAGARYIPTDSGAVKTVGVGVNEIKREMEEY